MSTIQAMLNGKQITKLPTSAAWYSSDRFMIFAAWLIAAATFLGLEKISVGNGFGWDGVVYAELVRDFHERAIATPVNSYLVQRILPSAIIHYSMRLLGCEFSDQNILYSFGVMNTLCITAMAWFWCRIVRHLQIGMGGKWLGFFGIFCNYFLTKHTSYYPCLTDVPGMTISFGMLYCYLKGRLFCLALLAIAGAFVWPVLLMLGAGLIWFRKPDATEAKPAPAPGNWAFIIAALVAYYAAVICAWGLKLVPIAMFGWLTPMRGVAWLSIALVAWFVFAATRRLIDYGPLFTWPNLRDGRLWMRRCLVIAMVLGVRTWQAQWATLPTILLPQNYLLLLTIASTAKPGVFWLGHILYFGPLLMIGLFYWQEIAAAIHRQGTGLTLVLLAFAAHAMDSESRHLIAAFPLIAPFIVQATERHHWSPRQYTLFACICLVYSKIWLVINWGPFHQNMHMWPDQLYLMNLGIFMTKHAYLIQGGVTLVAMFLLYRYCILPTRLPTTVQAPLLARRTPLETATS